MPGSPKSGPPSPNSHNNMSKADKRHEEAKIGNFFPEASFGSIPSNLLNGHGSSMLGK